MKKITLLLALTVLQSCSDREIKEAQKRDCEAYIDSAADDSIAASILTKRAVVLQGICIETANTAYCDSSNNCVTKSEAHLKKSFYFVQKADSLRVLYEKP